MGKGGAVLGLIGIILGAGGIAFGYFIWIGQNNNLTQPKVVGVWDGLTRNTDYPGFDQTHTWLFEFTDNEFNNSVYISVSNNNTRITLLKPGWYRIHLSALLNGLEPSNGFSQRYFIALLKDNSLIEYLYSLWTPSGSKGFNNVDSSTLVNSDGANYIEIRGTSSPQDDFNIYSTDSFNRFSIEFVST
ncbi:hypothetical protein LCGC14_2027460 [marine sediment metagenome]|uniref:Uncharacterized protein n=1 Tax=marine sediment metagenome TaxID=412755 RepID=A0A0F9H944_9ZZZZ